MGKAPDTDQVEEQVEEQSGAEVEGGSQDVGPDEAQPAYTGSVKVSDPEPADLGQLATVTVDQARAAAVAANPGTTAVEVELDNENGYLVYSVELSNGADVKVDAGTGKVLHTEQPGADDRQETAGEAETD
ncbi:MAG: PepSY domain-containing protein [Firmicutes bacterium]|nr:PepSY domain-containing protein [Bacillota bacterium]